MSMPSIQIRDVPPETHAALKARAARLGMSLSDFLRDEILKLAARPTTREWLASIPPIRSFVSVDDVVAAIREGREEQDRKWSS